jgi:2-oxoglutarate dehydrogenase E1 component
MYQTIRSHKTPAHLFASTLINKNLLTDQNLKEWEGAYESVLAQGLSPIAETVTNLQETKFFNWAPYVGKGIDNKISTKVALDHLIKLGANMMSLVQDVAMHPRVQKIYEERTLMYQDKKPLDWGAAELLTYASLMQDGYDIRLSGQDCRRGTFFHRHAFIFDQTTNEAVSCLVGLPEIAGSFTAIDSLLSEEAVLAFEYGYATTNPKTLVLWEAQFGDFANGAQVVIDQFISSGKDKWMRHCGIVLLLPHGQEGQGPEHSSGRIERFLQLCAQDNMRVCIPTTPAQLFHLLRLQMIGHDRHPLVIFSPKSFLRNKDAVSPLEALSKNKFQEVIVQQQHQSLVKRLIFCTGKIYYDLLAYQRDSSIKNTVLVRIEQL